MYEPWQTNKTVNSSYICGYLCVLDSSNAARSPSPFQWHLGKHSKPICKTKQTKKEKQTRCLVYFCFQNMTDEVEGEKKTFSAAATALKPWRAHCNQFWLCRRAGVHSGKLKWHTGVFQRANERKWQQMKLAGCGVLFSPACINEQAFPNRLEKLLPGGPRAFSFFICQVSSPHGETTGNTHTLGRMHLLGWRLLACTGTHSTSYAVQKSEEIVNNTVGRNECWRLFFSGRISN